MKLVLERFCYSETETEGRLWFDGSETSIVTLERPWIAGLPGGMPFKSCVPDGEYELVPHRRKNGDSVLALRNPDLGVYYSKAERGDRSGRYKILIHSANWVEQISGCIAPGLVRTISENRVMVRSSREAMKQIMAHKWDSILIEPTLGTKQWDD